MSHPYETRLQTKRKEILYKESLDINRLIDRIDAALTPKTRIQEMITFCQYFMGHHIIVAQNPSIKSSLWDKLVEMEQYALIDLQKLPPTLQSDQSYNNDLLVKRYLLIDFLTVMENVRLTYW